MPYLNSAIDGAQLFYRDYTPTASPPPFQPDATALGNPPKLTIVFIHGWPMSSAMFEHLMLPLSETYRLRCIAPDRRGFGKSDWTGGHGKGEAITLETFADDTVHILERVGLEEFVFVAASMGCGESVLAWERSDFVRSNCKGFIWMGPLLPYPVQTDSNPTAPSPELWASILTSLRTSRAAFVKASLPNVFGANVGIEVDGATLEHFERIVDQADALAMERCIHMFTDFTDKLRTLGKEGLGERVLVLHGDSDQSAPYEATTKFIEGLMPGTRVNLYERAAHGLYVTRAEKVVQHVLEFVKGVDVG